MTTHQIKVTPGQVYLWYGGQKWVAIDSGYPHEVSFLQAHKFVTPLSAAMYIESGVFKGVVPPTIVQVKDIDVTLTTIDNVLERRAAYAVKLNALNKEYEDVLK